MGFRPSFERVTKQKVDEGQSVSGGGVANQPAVQENEVGQEILVEPFSSWELNEATGFLKEFTAYLKTQASQTSLGKSVIRRSEKLTERFVAVAKMAEAAEAAKAKSESQERQRSLDEFVNNVGTLDFADTHKVVEWLGTLSRKKGYRDVKVNDSKRIREEFAQRGYEPEYPEVDEVAKEEDQSIFSKHIIESMLFCNLPYSETKDMGSVRDPYKVAGQLEDLWDKRFPDANAA